MAGITIRYCVPCRYQFKAMQDADAILKEFGQALSELRLVPADHGVYDVEVDGDLVFSLDRSEQFLETPELIQKIHARIDSPRPRRKKR
ncbi:MAG TPA: Rdx family protein [Thermoplasmata archaeon]|nr:Rdx family protein [Thermoplasmata archaeon]